MPRLLVFLARDRAWRVPLLFDCSRGVVLVPGISVELFVFWCGSDCFALLLYDTPLHGVLKKVQTPAIQR